MALQKPCWGHSCGRGCSPWVLHPPAGAASPSGTASAPTAATGRICPCWAGTWPRRWPWTTPSRASPPRYRQRWLSCRGVHLPCGRNGCPVASARPLSPGCQLDPGAEVVWGPRGRGAAAPHPAAGTALPGGEDGTGVRVGVVRALGHRPPHPRLSPRTTCAPRRSSGSHAAGCPPRTRTAREEGSGMGKPPPGGTLAWGASAAVGKPCCSASSAWPLPRAL